MAEIKVRLLPIRVPNYIIHEAQPRPQGEGFKENDKSKLEDLNPDTLAELCDDFRKSIFEKAGKTDPA